jgi:L-threonylcarbamoyladenylate synthase
MNDSVLPFLEDLKQCQRALQDGGLILYPTDTIWGIGCDATNPNAVKRVFELKNRADSKSLIILVAAQSTISGYVKDPDPRIFAHLKTVSKPTTVIYPGAMNLAANIVCEDGTVGIRIVTEPFCAELIRRFGKAIVSTSANVSGGPSPRNFREVPMTVRRGVDYVVHYKREDESLNKPSAIIQLDEHGTIKIIRQ